MSDLNTPSPAAIRWMQRRAAKQKPSMRRTFMGLLGLLVGYPFFAVAGYWIIKLFSSNTFDHSVEASMTAVFAIGPLGAIIGLVAGMIIGGKKQALGGQKQALGGKKQALKTPSATKDI
jgi:uncharacterized membrane protein YcjF (UPF0283 family)